MLLPRHLQLKGVPAIIANIALRVIGTCQILFMATALDCVALS